VYDHSEDATLQMNAERKVGIREDQRAKPLTPEARAECGENTPVALDVLSAVWNTIRSLRNSSIWISRFCAVRNADRMRITSGGKNVLALAGYSFDNE